MHKTALLSLVAVILAASLPACSSGEATDGVYTRKMPSTGGIGRVYMGREISQVMGHRGAGWLERPGRVREERTDLLVAGLPLEEDDVVADIGAGTGYFSFRVASRVPAGTVLAVDIQPEMLAIIERRKTELGAANVRAIAGTISDPGLDEASVDLAFIVDAWHEFSHPHEMGQAIFAALRPGGHFVLVEYRAEDRDLAIKPLHKMTEEQARREITVLGFEWLRTDSFLPTQHFLVFRKPG